MFAVMVEFANLVAERSPPLNSTSASVADDAMLRTLSVMAFTSSREYIGVEATTGSTVYTILVPGGTWFAIVLGHYGEKIR